MAPAAAVTLAHLLTPWPEFNVQDLLTGNYQLRAYSYGAITFLDLFLFWFCGAAIVLGVGEIENGRPPRPAAWLQAALRRTLALFATWAMPIIPASVLLVPWLIALTAFYHVLGDVHLTDPDVATQLHAISYYEFGGIALLAAMIPLAFLATAPIMQDAMRLPDALLLTFRTCLSRANATKFAALAVAVLGLWGFEQLAVGLLGQLDSYLTALGLISMTVSALGNTVIAAYAAVVVGLAWKRGYFVRKSP